eukprot:IDg18369t1
MRAPFGRAEIERTITDVVFFALKNAATSYWLHVLLKQRCTPASRHICEQAHIIASKISLSSALHSSRATVVCLNGALLLHLTSLF